MLKRFRFDGIGRWYLVSFVFMLALGLAMIMLFQLVLLRGVPHLKEERIAQIFALGQAYVEQSEGVESVTFFCTALEETACWFGERDLTERDLIIAEDVTRVLVRQLGRDSIELGTQYGVLEVRCRRPLSGEITPTCEANGDWGEWVPVAVR